MLPAGGTMRIRTVAAVAFLALLMAVPAQAQRKKRKKKEDPKVEEARKAAAGAAADATSALKTVQELKGQIEGLKKEISTLRASRKKEAGLQKQITILNKRLGTQELKLSAVKLDMAEGNQTAGFKDGFFLRSSNRRFLLRIRGFLQGGYTARIYNDEISYGGVTVGEHESSFDLRRARLELGGHVSSKILGYHLELNFGDEDPGPLLAAYGSMSFFPPLNLRFGKQKIPMGRQFMIHSAYQHFIDRSSVTQAFVPGWDTGLVIHGDVPVFGSISYQLGIFNGAGSSALHDDNIDFMYVARMVFEPMGKVPYSEGDSFTSEYRLAMGGSFFYNLARTDRGNRLGYTDAKKAADKNDADVDGVHDNVGIYQVAAELTARLRMILWQSEFFYRLEDPGAVEDTRSFWGVYTQVGVVPHFSHFEVAVRYGFWEPHNYGALRNTPRPASVHEVGAVFSFFIWKRRLKWMLDYNFQLLQDLQTSDKKVLGDLNVHQIRVQTQVYF